MVIFLTFSPNVQMRDKGSQEQLSCQAGEVKREKISLNTPQQGLDWERTDKERRQDRVKWGCSGVKLCEVICPVNGQQQFC